MDTVIGYAVLIGIFALVGGLYEGWHTWREAKRRRADWLDEGNRRFW